MIEGPLGGAAFNNEFGRPNLCRLLPRLRAAGRRRAARLPQADHDRRRLGRSRRRPDEEGRVPAGTLLVQLGGPGMRIGMGGGAASSMAAGANAADARLRLGAARQPQRSSAGRRRSSTTALGARRGQSHPGDPRRRRRRHQQRLPELVDGAGARLATVAGAFEESGMAPKEIWCNESQERYVIAHRSPRAADLRGDLRARERCPFAVVGVATASAGSWSGRPRDAGLRSRPAGRHADGGAAGQAAADAPRRAAGVWRGAPLDLTGVTLAEAALDVLRHPTVASKRFLVTIGDRTVGGLPPRPDGRAGRCRWPIAR